MEIPAGWYPDPAGDTTKIRYWDGQAWTDQTQPAVNPELVSNANNAGAYVPAPAPAPAPTMEVPGQPAPAPAPAPLQPIYASGQEIPPYAMAAPPTDRKGFAVASLVLGIVSMLFCCLAYLTFLPALLSIIFGALGLKSSKKGIAIAGLILGAVAIVIGILLTILYVDMYQHPMNYGLDSNAFDISSPMTF
jgi:hypothetical protein